jgi:hypothetical protein
MPVPFFLLPSEMQKHIQDEEKRKRVEAKKFYEEVLAPNAIDWDLNFKWKDLNQGRVCFKADTYNPDPSPLFDVEPVELTHQNMKMVLLSDIRGPKIKPRNGGDEKYTTQWVYRRVILPRGEKLRISSGNRHGYVYFDDQIVFPALYEHKPWVTYDSAFTVWMSLTPMEVFTQRAGIKHCSGRVCIGGLGLGWFLEQVAAKRSVKEIVVVEESKELLQWFGRKLVKRVARESGKTIKVVCADVFEYLKSRHEGFDKIALDVFESYGNNNAEDDRRIRELLYKGGDFWGYGRKELINPKKLWCWGSAKIGENPETRGQWWY